MTHTLTKELMGTVVLDESAIPLLPAYSVVIPALCIGVIRHLITLDSDGEEPSWVLIIADPQAILAHGLLVISQAVEDGEVATVVFNITNVEKRIKKNEYVSRIVKVPGAAWTKL